MVEVKVDDVDIGAIIVSVVVMVVAVVVIIGAVIGGAIMVDMAIIAGMAGMNCRRVAK